MIGTIVFWSLSGGIDRSALEDVLNEVGHPEWMPNPVSDKGAFIRALKKMEKDRIIVKVKDDDAEVVYAIAHADVDPDNVDIDLSLDDVIIYDKTTNDVYCKHYKLDKDEIKSLMNFLKAKLDVNDIRKMIKHVLEWECKAVLIRKRGGVYLVPPKHKDKVMLLKEVVEKIGSEFYTLDLIQNNETTQDAKRLITSGIFEELEDELKKLETIDLTQRKVRSSTITSFLKKYKFLRAKAEVYKELLQEKLIEANRKITELETKAKGILLEIL